MAVASRLPSALGMVEEDPRQVLWCRLGLLAVSLLHWLAFSMLVGQHKAAMIQADLFSNLC